MAMKGFFFFPLRDELWDMSSVSCVLTIKVNDSLTMGHYCKRLLSIMSKQPLI